MHLEIDYAAQVDSTITLGILGVEGPYLNHPNTRVQFIMRCTNYESYDDFMSPEFCSSIGFTRMSWVEGRFNRRIRTYLFSREVTGYLRNPQRLVQFIASKINKRRQEIDEAREIGAEFDPYDMHTEL